MNKSESIKNLSREEFRRLTGVQKPTFELMKKIFHILRTKSAGEMGNINTNRST